MAEARRTAGKAAGQAAGGPPGGVAALVARADWAATPLGPLEGWPEGLRAVLDLTLASPGVATLVVGPERRLLYNDAAARLYGRRHPAALGRPLAESFPEGYAAVAALYDRAFAGEVVAVPAQPVAVAGPGPEVWEATLVPVRGAGGAVLAVHMTGQEVGGRLHAEAALREGERRHQTLLATMDEGFAECEFVRDEAGRLVDFRYLALNPALERLTGLRVADVIGRRISEVLTPVEARYWTESFGEVVRTGEPAHLEHFVEPLGRWFRVNVTPYGPDRVAAFYENITEGKEAEARLRASEERQAFLLRLSDALGPLGDAEDIERAATRLLGEALGASRVFYASVEPDGDTGVIRAAYARGVASGAGRYALSAFASRLVPEWRAGRTTRTADVEADPRYSDAERAAFAAVSARAAVGVPLLRGGRLVALMGVNHAGPRAWTDEEVGLVTEVAARVWDASLRADAEAALRGSEERFRTLAQGIPQLVWRAADHGQWTWASPQWTEFTGQVEEQSHGWGWLDPLHPDDRDAARAGWERSVATGEFHADFRLREARNGRYRWFQSRATPVRDEAGNLVEWLGTTTDVQDLRELQDRQAVLVAELQHRTRNLMGVVRSVMDATIRRSGALEGFVPVFRGRLEALARVQGLLSRLGEGDRIASDELIREELGALGALDGEGAGEGAGDGPGRPVALDGPPGVRLRSSSVQTFALALHELATNAAKYGALAQPGGRLLVRWRVLPGADGSGDGEGAGEGVGDGRPETDGGDGRDGPRLRVEWVESGVALPGPETGAPGGFGRELIERALPYQLGAETTYLLRGDGVRCTITLPLSSSQERARA